MKSDDIRIRHQTAVEMTDSCGVDFFNPIIGESSADTLRNLNDAIETLHFQLKEGELSEKYRGSLVLCVRAIWSAVQFEMEFGCGSEGGRQ